MSDKELVERLLDFEKVTVGDARDSRRHRRVQRR
jgi:hypothetical protein